jgi:hypothetical protein
MSQEIVTGKIVDWEQGGTVLIRAPLPRIETAVDRKYSDVQVGYNDGRHISPEQRRKAYVLMSQVAEYIHGVRNADTLEDTKEFLKADFVFNHMQAMQRRLFSLSTVSMNTASDFITYLIDFIIRNDVPSDVSLIENCEDIAKMVYACLMAKKCVCCGKPADLHHVDSVGAHGGNRDKINHIGLQCLPLCRVHHTELHGMGNKDFMEKYHLQSVAIDKKIAKLYKLNTKERKDT